MAAFTKLLIYGKTISFPVGSLCLRTLTSDGSGGQIPVNNFATDQPIFTNWLSFAEVLVKELIAEVAKFCVVVRIEYTTCVI